MCGGHSLDIFSIDYGVGEKHLRREISVHIALLHSLRMKLESATEMNIFYKII